MMAALQSRRRSQNPAYGFFSPGHGEGRRVAYNAELESPSSYRDRKGTWSLFVTKNWRMTFRINQEEIEIIDLDYEDYH